MGKVNKEIVAMILAGGVSILPCYEDSKGAKGY